MAADNGSKRLYEAAIEGNVTTLLELLRQDPMLLARVNLNDFNETPLHVAALLGHVGFVDEILKRRPQLAKELDSRRFSALHLAAAEGFVEIVKLLLRVDADMCFVCNQDGRNAIHLAAVRGRLDVLAELVRVRPAAARMAVDGGGTVLHLCVKYNQVEALKKLIETVAVDDSHFVNAQDDYGFTILHLAVSMKQLQAVEYLINHTRIKVNAKTTNGLTALDILTQSHRDLKDMDIAETLTAANAIRTTPKKPSSLSRSSSSPSSCVSKMEKTQSWKWLLSAVFHNGDWWFFNQKSEWLRKQDSLMVVASLIATMAFQAGVNPPGGIWQDDKASGNPNQPAGTSIFAGKHIQTYNKFLVFNTMGFMTSLIAILMIITGLPEKRIFMRVLIVTMWIAVSSMAYTYGYSIRFFTPRAPKLSGSGAPSGADSVIFLIAILVAIVATSSIGLFLIGKLFYVHSRQNKSTKHSVPSEQI
ncbi:Ankyrin repeat-containing protein ITN1, partial [Cucurbita argyrosperma subsp. argyrosperma]